MANPGVCKGQYTRYAYDSASNRCFEFLYGGCGGNPNRFVRKQDCIEICKAFLDDEAELQISSEELSTKTNRNKPITSYTVEEDYSQIAAESTTRQISSNEPNSSGKSTTADIYNLKPILKLTKAMPATSAKNNFIPNFTKAKTISQFAIEKPSKVNESYTIYNVFNFNPLRTKPYLVMRVNG